MNLNECRDELMENVVIKMQDDFSKTKTYLDLQDKLILIQKDLNPDIQKIIDEYSLACDEIYTETIKYIYRETFSSNGEDALLRHPKGHLSHILNKK